MSKRFRLSFLRSFGATLTRLTLSGLFLFSVVLPLSAQEVTGVPGLAAEPEIGIGEVTTTIGPGSSPLSPNTFAQEALKKLSGEMQARNADLEEAAVVEEQVLSPLPTGVLGGKHEQVLEELMGMIFLQKGNSWFTQTVREAVPVPYEFKDLQLSGPTRLVVTEADKANGIDQRLSYGFSVSSHRRYTKASGWQTWEKGKPVLLTGIIMNRVKGVWVVASSPRENFSLK